jgi:hypothetical protein
MVDIDTFVTVLYVMVDDFCKSQSPDRRRPGARPSLSRSEVITLALVGQWARFRGQRDFYRFARNRLRSAFPNLPDRGQYNRLVRAHRHDIVAFSLHLVELLQARQVPYEILDTTGIPVRNVKRRGTGWLTGRANIGWCTRLGWFNGFTVLLAVTPEGVVTGFGFGEGSAKDQPLAETMLALRHQHDPPIPSVGRPALGHYVADAGFVGQPNHERWRLLYEAHVVCQPSHKSTPWPKALRRWLHSLRQIVETVYGRLMEFFRLDKERPHSLDGFQANLSAKIALHNFCIWINKQLGRPPLAFADLLGW